MINKIIDEKYFELIYPVKDENNELIIYYRKLIFQGKKFTLFTKKDDIQNYNNLYYYCCNHRTTKTSKLDNDKGHKIRIYICNAKIKYEK